MSLRGRISAHLGGRLTRLYLERLRSGGVWSVNPSRWYALPGAVKNWLCYRVFASSERNLKDHLAKDSSLAPLDLPPPNGYNLSLISRIVLQDLVKRTRPHRIMELGGGVSTLILAALMAPTGPESQSSVIISVDHDASWLEETRRLLAQRGLADRVQLIHAPLRETELSCGRSLTYGLSEDELKSLAGPRGVDLLFIDGPPCKIGRASCLPLVASCLADGAVVALDDSYREGEIGAWRSWMELYPARLGGSRLCLTDRGLMTGSWSNPARPPSD